MALDLSQFAGTIPYASELFGVYQPLLGWKGLRMQLRVSKERRGHAQALIERMLRDNRFRHAVAQSPQPYGPDADFAASLPGWMETLVGRQAQTAARAFVQKNGRTPTAAEWVSVIGGLDLQTPIALLGQPPTPDQNQLAQKGIAAYPAAKLSPPQLEALGAQPIKGTDVAIGTTAPAANYDAVRESIVAGTMQFVSRNAPEALTALLLEKGPNPMTLTPWVDPLSTFDPDTQKAVLSPVGVLYLYCEYFYEFSTFLGPAVGHVWVSPGGSLELFEVHTRRSLEEQSVELSTSSTATTQSTTTTDDELSTAIADQNSRNTNLGISTTAGVNFGVFQASASGQFGVQTAQTASEQTAHKETRQQSEQIANEIRRDFKTTYRTSVETTDVSSRRYVLANTTDKVVNYELRRKMRQVGVQVQHIATQLCWQSYLDEPGQRLGVGELVHASASHDLEAAVQPPDMPEPLQPKTTDFQVEVPFHGLFGNDDNGGALYVNGTQGPPLPTQAPRDIQYIFDFPVTPPAAGYTIVSAVEKNVQRVDPNNDPAEVAAIYNTFPPSKQVPDNMLVIELTNVKWNDQSAIGFDLELQWAPPSPDPGMVEYEKQYREYTKAKKRAAHADYVNAVRDRVNLEGQVQARPSDDLRSEERGAILRRLVADLTKAAPHEGHYVTIELIRALFDVDNMLYFVAEDWWMPRTHHTQQAATTRDTGGSHTIGGSDVEGWGGIHDKDRDNYLITESSSPAPMGASLGWLLQLDGDERRNAFLNSPFVKAVIPIRPGKEVAALNWLKLAHVEGTDGLQDTYGGPEPNLQGTIEHALLTMAAQLAAAGTNMDNVLKTESVYETGFNPLAGGFRATGVPGELYDQWVEVLPTDQTVAVDYVVPSPT
jgi:enamine deaminase RidA (YjgF/YER057c/UK114 family)